MKLPKFSKLFGVCVLGPALLGAAYFGAVRDDVYDSQAKVVLRSVGNEGKAGTLGALLGMSSPLATDSANLKELMLSYDMLNSLEKEVGLTSVWGARSADIVGRLWPSDPSQERLLRYYLRHVTVDIDDRTGMLTIQASSFEPGHAQAITAALVERANRYINEVNNRLARQDMTFLEEQAKGFHTRLTAARAELEAFQTANGILDAEASAQAQSALLSRLEADEAAASAELSQAQTYLTQDSYGLAALKNKVAALRAELERQRKKATAPGMKGEKALRFRELKSNVAFLEDAYTRTKAATEQARLDASRQARELVVIQAPNLPQSPRYLAGLSGMGLWTFVLLAIYTIARLVRAVLRERRAF